MAKAKTYKVFVSKQGLDLLDKGKEALASTNKSATWNLAYVLTPGHNTGTTSPHIASLAGRILKGGKYTKAQVLELAGSCVTQADGSGGNGHRIKKAKLEKVRYYKYTREESPSVYLRVVGTTAYLYTPSNRQGVKQLQRGGVMVWHPSSSHMEITPREAAAIRAKWKPRVKAGKRGKR